MMLLRALTVLSLILLSACASKQTVERVISNNDQFTLVAVKQTDTYASLANEFLGNKKYASIIQRYNPDLPLDTIEYVAIPKTVINKSAIFDNGIQRIPILCYHQFTNDKKTRNRMIVPKHEFSAQMRYLHKNGYQVVTLKDVGEFIRGRKELPLKSVVITIDDGYKSFQDIAMPILEEYQFPSTMFVYPDFVGAGAALSWQDVKNLTADPLVDIQSHSVSHASLSRKPGGEAQTEYLRRLESEVDLAQEKIFKRTGNKVNQFAYPYGNTSATLIKMLEEQGYDVGVTVQRGTNPSFSAPYLLNRTMIYGGDSLERFIQSLHTFEEIEAQHENE